MQDQLQQLYSQLEATNTIKQANDKEIKRCRQRIQELESANKPLQAQSEKIWKQIKDLESFQEPAITLNSLQTFANNCPNLTVSQFANMCSTNLEWYSNNTNKGFLNLDLSFANGNNLDNKKEG